MGYRHTTAGPPYFLFGKVVHNRLLFDFVAMHRKRSHFNIHSIDNLTIRWNSEKSNLLFRLKFKHTFLVPFQQAYPK